jgi:hypothetical protein
MLVASTLLHYLPLWALVLNPEPAFIGYAAVISCSATLSAVWHHLGEPDGPILYADYAMAAVWSAYSIILLDEYNPEKVRLCINIEAVLCCANWLVSLMGKNDYKIWHSLWHILSAVKGCYFVWLIIHNSS